MGTALTAAQLAPRILEDPRRWVAEYDHYMKQLLPIQDTFDYFVHTPAEDYEPASLHRYSDAFVKTSLVRLAGSTRMRDSRLATLVSPAFGWLFRHPAVLRDYCSVRRVDRATRVA